MKMGQYSYETGIKKTFQAVDYVVFGGTLLLSAAIGLFYAIKDRKRNTTDNYLLAGREMHPVPVAISLTATFISAITILGTPAEVYVHGTMYWWLSVGIIISAFGAVNIFVPIFYKLGVTSVFQYIEMRFGKLLRVIMTALYLVNMMLYMSIVLYVPSLALNAVTGLTLWGSVVVVGFVCIFYTTLGGMKAVLWTDTLQMSIVYIGMITLLIQGSIAVGGFSNAWNIADKNGRILLTDFDPDPKVRHSVWTVMVGAGIAWLSNMGVNQACVQRAMAVGSLRQSKIAYWLMVPGIAAIITLTCLVGVVLYAFYANCDPVKSGLINKVEEMVPLYMMDLLGNFVGLPGLLLSCVFSGCLSTVSSGLNAIAAVMLEDFSKAFCCHKISTGKATLLSKIFVVVFGLLGLLFAFVVSKLGGLVLQLTYTLFGVFSGPMLGLFTLGILFPWANKLGSLIGYLTSVVIMFWIALGALITKTSTARKLGVSIDGCMMNVSHVKATNMTIHISNMTLEPDTVSTFHEEYDGVKELYKLSYLWYATLAVVITVVVGLVASLITGFCTWLYLSNYSTESIHIWAVCTSEGLLHSWGGARGPTDPTAINPSLICPFFDVCFPFLPEKIRKPLRFGVRHGEAEDTEILTDKQSTKMKSYHLGESIDFKEDGWKDKEIETVMENYELHVDSFNQASQDQKHIVVCN